MVRSRLILTLVGLLGATMAEAQNTPITGFLTGHIGVAQGGDIVTKGLTPGASVAIIESSGWGAEIDLAHTTQFNDELFEESGITSFMINALGLWPHPIVRPFGEAGVGLLRTRAVIANGVPVIGRTDWGFNAGGGVLVMLNDAVGVRGDVRYFRYFQRHEDLLLTDTGFFDFWRTSVGLTWSWPLR